MVDHDHQTSSTSRLGSFGPYLIAAAVVVVLLVAPSATRDIASMAWLSDPKVVRILIGLCGLFVVVFAFLRSHRLRRESLLLEQEIDDLRADGDVTLVRIAEKLERLRARAT